MSKFLKWLVQGRKILNTSKIFNAKLGRDYLQWVLINHYYTPVLQLHKNGEPEDFVFKGWTFSLVAHDISEVTCKRCDIPCCKVSMHSVYGSLYYRFYFLLAENKASNRKYLIPVDTWTFAWADKDIISAPSESVREGWFREALNKWVVELCNTDADITGWRYLRGFFAWWSRLRYDIMRCDYV